MVSEDFGYRTLCVYFHNNRIGCFLFYGNGKYISHRKEVVFGFTSYLEDYKDDHDDLISFILQDKGYITEDELKERIQSIGDYKIGLSERYRYPFHRKKQDVFNTFSKNNDLKNLKTMVRKGG